MHERFSDAARNETDDDIPDEMKHLSSFLNLMIPKIKMAPISDPLCSSHVKN